MSKIKEEVHWWSSLESLQQLTNNLSVEGIEISLKCGYWVINKKSFDDLTPLFFVVKFHDQPRKIIEILLNSGARIEPEHKWMQTPLMYATENHYGGIEAVELLIKSGAKINGQDLSKQTPIFYAAMNNASCNIFF